MALNWESEKCKFRFWFVKLINGSTCFRAMIMVPQSLPMVPPAGDKTALGGLYTPRRDKESKESKACNDGS